MRPRKGSWLIHDAGVYGKVESVSVDGEVKLSVDVPEGGGQETLVVEDFDGWHRVGSYPDGPSFPAVLEELLSAEC